MQNKKQAQVSKTAKPVQQNQAQQFKTPQALINKQQVQGQAKQDPKVKQEVQKFKKEQVLAIFENESNMKGLSLEIFNGIKKKNPPYLNYDEWKIVIGNLSKQTGVTVQDMKFDEDQLEDVYNSFMEEDQDLKKYMNLEQFRQSFYVMMDSMVKQLYGY